MCDKHFTKRTICSFCGISLMVVLLAGCGGASTTASVNTGLSNNTSATATATNAAVTNTANTATATLKHQPTGSASLSWDHTTHMLTATLMLTGLAPNSIHPVRINEGSCSTRNMYRDRMLYSLPNITADAHGIANKNVKATMSIPGGIPAKSWYLDVYNGPGTATSDEATSLACADVVNSDTSLKSSQSVQATFQPTHTGSQNASGTTDLSLSGRTLTVKLDVSGLAPRSDHEVHIHAGSCASQGPVLYPLTTLKADASGKATSTTTIQNVTSIPASGWYVNIHNSTNLSTQAGFDPIACGDVSPR